MCKNATRSSQGKLKSWNLCSCSPKSVGTLRGSYGSRKAAGAQLGLRSLQRAAVFAAIYSTFMTRDIVHVHFDCAGSQNLGVCGGCFSRLRCGAVRISVNGDHFSWQAQGNPRVLVLQSRLFVTGARDRSCFTSTCTFRGRCSTLDMVW